MKKIDPERNAAMSTAEKTTIRVNAKCKCGVKSSKTVEVETRRHTERSTFGPRTITRRRWFLSGTWAPMDKGISEPCECGREHGLLFRPVRHARREDGGHKCDARCLNATGHNCECQCGGKNHGAANA